MSTGRPQFLARADLQQLLDALTAQGYECVGPQLHDEAITYLPLQHVDQFPCGIEDEQLPGHYRYQKTPSHRYFSWANGAQAIKPLVFAPRDTLWNCEFHEGSLKFSAVQPEARQVAIIGVRACDIAALKLSDAHFLKNESKDVHYRSRREKLFLVAVNCSHPAATCFCASTGDGPVVEEGADIILDELDEGFSIHAASEEGEHIIQSLPLKMLRPGQQKAIDKQRLEAGRAQRRSVENMHGRLVAQAKSDHWQKIAERCLSCGNCTSVCPTCFCNNEFQDSSLDGTQAEQVRQWDSCFTQGHSYIHGVVIRSETSHRYRQWLTHKFDTWHDQYGRSGCVGCGRCITWCPVGIDVTEENTVFVSMEASI